MRFCIILFLFQNASAAVRRPCFLAQGELRGFPNKKGARCGRPTLFLGLESQHKPSQVRNCSPGNMEPASSRGHEASPQSGAGQEPRNPRTRYIEPSVARHPRWYGPKVVPNCIYTVHDMAPGLFGANVFRDPTKAQRTFVHLRTPLARPCLPGILIAPTHPISHLQTRPFIAKNARRHP